MKRVIVLLSAVLVFLFLPEPILASEEIKVFVDGKGIQFDEQPIIKDGTTLVQFRPIFESLGYSVTWDGQNKLITGVKGDTKIELKINNSIAIVDGKENTLSQAPTIINGNTLVPLRFVSEASGAEVIWSSKYRTIHVFLDEQELLRYYVITDNISGMKELLDKGVNPNNTDYLGISILEWSILNPEETKLLLDAGADPNTKDSSGNSILYLAVLYGKPETVENLVHSGADLGAASKSGKTSLELAEEKYFYVKDEYKENYIDIISILVDEMGTVETQYYDDGSIYFGQMVNGLKRGQGTYTWADGSKYVGFWINDQINGYGTLTLSNGGKYEGLFENEMFNGLGTATLVDGTMIIGNWVNDYSEGEGIVLLVDGTKFEGTFVNGLLEGEVIVTLPNGEKYIANFEAGKIVEE